MAKCLGSICTSKGSMGGLDIKGKMLMVYYSDVRFHKNKIITNEINLKNEFIVYK